MGICVKFVVFRPPRIDENAWFGIPVRYLVCRRMEPRGATVRWYLRESESQRCKKEKPSKTWELCKNGVEVLGTVEFEQPD